MTSRGEAFGTARTAHAVAQKLGLVLLEQPWVLEWGEKREVFGGQ